MTTELFNLAQLGQEWLTFSLIFALQLLLVLALRKPVRARLGAVACYRLWLLPLLWVPFYVLGPTLFAALANSFTASPQQGGAYPAALQQFMEIELLPFSVDLSATSELSAGGSPAFQKWTLLASIQAIGTLALIVWQGCRWLNFSRFVRTRAAPLAAGDRQRKDAATYFDARVPVVQLPGMNSAALFGAFKPVLLLPEGFSQRYDSSQRQIILAHEAVHLRRGDNAWNLLALLLIALFWTNPLVFLAWRYFRLDQELSCDALALNQLSKEQQKRYARTLIDSLGAESVYKARPALTAWNNLNDIRERSLMIKQHLHTAARPVVALFSLLLLAVGGASLTVALAELGSANVQAAETTTQRDEQQARQGELQGRAAEQQARQVEQQARQVEQQSRQVEEQARQVEQQARQVEQQSRQLQQQAEQVERQARQVEQQKQQVEQQARQVEQQARQVEQQAREVEQQARQIEQQKLGANDSQTGRILTEAIGFLNNDQFAEAGELLGTLRLDQLSAFERSRYEQLMFNLAMNAENFPEARAHLQAAIDSGGLNETEESQLRYQMAQLYVQEEKYAEAAAALEAWIAAEANPNSAAYYLLAASYYYQDSFDKALPNAQKSVDLAGDKPQEGWLSLLASLYIQDEQYVAAEPVLARMVELFPDKVTYQTQLEGLRATNAQQ